MHIFDSFVVPGGMGDCTTSPCRRGVRHLSTINVICGPNNSGKSRLLRHLFASLQNANPCFTRDFGVPEFRSANVRDSAARWGSKLNQIFRDHPGIKTIVHALRDAGTREQFEALQAVCLGDLSVLDAESQDLVENGHGEDLEQIGVQLRQNAPHKDTRVAFVPAIRTCRQIGEEDAFASYVKQTYFGDSPHPKAETIFTGRDLFTKIRQHLLGTLRQRHKIGRFEQALSEFLFSGQPVSLSPREGEGELYIRIAPEPALPVAHLGDGVQHVIIQLAPAFLLDGEELALFIEEPELYLHPGMQRELFEMLFRLDELAEWKRHQVFVVTHSNHVLDLTLDHERMTIIRMQKQPAEVKTHPVERELQEEHSKFEITRVAGPDMDVLRDLGVKVSSVFLANCTVWVEGPSDRMIIRHYLNLYAEEMGTTLREDLDYSFVIYGGSLAESWSFLNPDGPRAERLCAPLLFVADGDVGDEKKGDRKQRLEKELGDSLCLLRCREIENTVTIPQLAEIIARLDDRLDVSTLRTEGLSPIAKTHLGKVIMEMVPADKPKPRVWQAEDGGIAEHWKKRFPAEICEVVRSYGTMSQSAKAVARRIYEFIDSHRAPRLTATADPD